MGTLNQRKKSISRGVTASLVATVLLVTVISVSAILYYYSVEEGEALDQMADNYISHLVSILENPLWNYDYDQVTSICNAFTQNQLIASIEVINSSGERIVNIHKSGQREGIVRSGKVVHDNQEIGQAVVSVSMTSYYQKLFFFIKLAAVTTVLVLLALTIVTGGILRFFLDTPFRQLGIIAQSFASGRYDTDERMEPFAEFLPFTDVLYQMGEKIKEQIHELQAAELATERSNRRLSIINEILSFSLDASSLEQIIDHFVQAVLSGLRLGDAVKGAVFLLEDEKTLVLSAQRNFGADFGQRCGHLTVDACFCGEAVIAGETVFSMPAEDGVFCELSLCSRYCVPLKSGIQGPMLGVFVLCLDKVEGPDENIVLALEAACTLLSTIIGRKKAIERQKELEVKAVAHGKLASLGEISAGIAHEINQPLSFIRIVFEATLRDIENQSLDQKELNDDCGDALKQVSRISSIIDHLRVFGRDDATLFTEVLLEEVWKNTLILMYERVRVRNITLEEDIQVDLGEIYGNSVKLEQVFINLLQNSIDALAGRKNGRITVVMRQESEQAVVRFYDNGPGVPENIREKIFEPFYSTKEVGKGTGLGLSIVYGIVSEHNGDIEYDSLAEGAAFVMRLPFAADRKDAQEQEC